jgi:hypothetical protein
MAGCVRFAILALRVTRAHGRSLGEKQILASAAKNPCGPAPPVSNPQTHKPVNS